MSRPALRAWAPPLSYAALIFALSAQSRPLPFLPEEVLAWSAALHLVEYAVLGWLVARALGRGHPSPARTFAGALVLASLYGASDEIHQAFVPNRSAEVADWVADTAGSALGAAAAAWLRRRGGAD